MHQIFMNLQCVYEPWLLAEALQRITPNDALEIRDRTIFNFNLGLPDTAMTLAHAE